MLWVPPPCLHIVCIGHQHCHEHDPDPGCGHRHAMLAPAGELVAELHSPNTSDWLMSQRLKAYMPATASSNVLVRLASASMACFGSFIRLGHENDPRMSGLQRRCSWWGVARIGP